MCYNKFDIIETSTIWSFKEITYVININAMNKVQLAILFTIYPNFWRCIRSWLCFKEADGWSKILRYIEIRRYIRSN